MDLRGRAKIPWLKVEFANKNQKIEVLRAKGRCKASPKFVKVFISRLKTREELTIEHNARMTVRLAGGAKARVAGNGRILHTVGDKRGVPRRSDINKSDSLQAANNTNPDDQPAEHRGEPTDGAAKDDTHSVPSGVNTEAGSGMPPQEGDHLTPPDHPQLPPSDSVHDKSLQFIPTEFDFPGLQQALSSDDSMSVGGAAGGNSGLVVAGSESNDKIKNKKKKKKKNKKDTDDENSDLPQSSSQVPLSQRNTRSNSKSNAATSGPPRPRTK